MSRGNRHQRHPYPDKKLPRNGAALLALYIGKSLRRPFTIEDLHSIAPTKWRLETKYRKRQNEYLERLVNWGLLNQTAQDSYAVTNEGIKYIYRVGTYYAKEDPRRSPIRD